jgi:hypothetical protein
LERPSGGIGDALDLAQEYAIEALSAKIGGRTRFVNGAPNGNAKHAKPQPCLWVGRSYLAE